LGDRFSQNYPFSAIFAIHKPGSAGGGPGGESPAIMTPEREQRITSVLDKRQDDLTIVLENVFDPHNISAVMRTCDAVGVQDIFILNTRIPRHKKWGAKSSSSAAQWLTIHQFTDARECFDALRHRADRIFTTHLADDAISLYGMDLTGRIALVFGNEHSGVSDEIRAFADGNFVIPMAGIIQSLNISVACAVSLYEAYRQKAAAGHYDRRSLPPARYDSLLKEWSRGQLSASPTTPNK
jgi:tRNA (guanosine-2'-O-)-methyltransferase